MNFIFLLLMNVKNYNGKFTKLGNPGLYTLTYQIYESWRFSILNLILKNDLQYFIVSPTVLIYNYYDNIVLNKCLYKYFRCYFC